MPINKNVFIALALCLVAAQAGCSSSDCEACEAACWTADGVCQTACALDFWDEPECGIGCEDATTACNAACVSAYGSRRLSTTRHLHHHATESAVTQQIHALVKKEFSSVDVCDKKKTAKAVKRWSSDLQKTKKALETAKAFCKAPWEEPKSTKTRILRGADDRKLGSCRANFSPCTAEHEHACCSGHCNRVFGFCS